MLSLVIPSHSRADLLRACLASVARHAPSGTEVVVVDDASQGGAVSQAAGEFPGVRVLRREVRGGFCAAANAGIALATQPIVELLNDDTEVCAGWANAALNCFDAPEVGAVAPLVLQWPSGVDGEAVVDSAGDGYHLGGFAWKRGHGKRLGPEHLRPGFVFGASGAAAFYRREALLAVGGFAESFGAYFEDVDLSWRLRSAGWRVRYEPASRVLHHVSASYGRKVSGALLEQQSRNEELVFWRNVPARQMWRALPMHVGVLLAKACRRLWRGEFGPFLRGRLEALLKWREIMTYRRVVSQSNRSSTSNRRTPSRIAGQRGCPALHI